MKTIELKNVSATEFMSIPEAALELGIKESAVRNYLSMDRFTTYKFKTLTLLKIDEIRTWKYKRKKR